jgi:predicted DNA-binding protein with PD1-like motif
MFSSEIATGRTVLVVLQPGDDILSSIVEACTAHGIAQGIIPVFLGAFSSVTIIGTHEEILDEDAPLPLSVGYRNTEGTGSGTLVSVDGIVVPHVHVSVGAKGEGAAAYAGHLLSGTVQYVAEIVIVEVLSPVLEKRVDAAARGLANLWFDHHPRPAEAS